MHDGAVIIRDGRVWQAGAFLPLAGTASRDRTLGARHRAALGISEESDAVVVVVSEERGQISLCFDGNIVRNLDIASLRDALFALFFRPASVAKPSRPEGRRDSTPRMSVPAPPPPVVEELDDGGLPEAPTPSIKLEERSR